MFDLTYYLIDVGENYCHIHEKNAILSISEAFFKKEKDKLQLIKELLIQSVKKKAANSNSEEFKVVAINKKDKLSVESEVEDETTNTVVAPIISNDTQDVYIVKQGYGVSIECQVIERQTEIRYMKYDSIIPTHKARSRAKTKSKQRGW